MKRALFLVLILVAVGCKKDADDIRDSATGRYTGNATFYVLKGNDTLVQTGSVTTDPINISKNSASDNIVIDFGDGDVATGTHVKPSSKGFTFDIDPFVGSGFSFSGYAGYESDGGHYDGGFNKAANEIELWYQYTHNDSIKVIKCKLTRH